MNLFLAERAQSLREKMDEPDCDPEQLNNTYRYFKTVNRLVSGWQMIFRREILPVLQEARGEVSLLDIGCGGGDVSAWIVSMAVSAGFPVRMLAVDIDQRAIDYASLQWSDLPIRFEKVHTSTLLERGERFDLILSNHVLHHLSNGEIGTLFDQAERLAIRKVLFNDIERNALAYYGFSAMTAPWFTHSFIREDGLVSIRRSFTKKELHAIAPHGWKVTRPFPFRLLAKLDKK